MSRSVAWRNKPTALITQMIPVANQYKLYLVHETGPTSFVFKDEQDNKFKVSIGSVVTCSCGIVQNDHCIHTLYVLLKRFKVSPNNPIIWQASYLDSELEGLVQYKYEEKKKEERKKHQYKKVNQIAQQVEQDGFPVLQQGAECPICYEATSNDCYSTCKTCKNSLHSKCLKVWSQYKEEGGLPVSCPMCRSHFQNPMLTIFKDLERWQQRFQNHKGSHCRGCGMKNIKGVIFKCLLCSGCDLCKLCYEGNQHPEHDRFVTKRLISDGWKWAPVRPRKGKKMAYEQMKEAPMRELNNLQDGDAILDLFPTLKQHDLASPQSMEQLGIVGNVMMTKQICFKCKKFGNDSMRRLNCSHSIHQQCLRSMIANKEYLCEVDGEIYCPGYFQALGIKVAKPKKKPVECVVLKNEEEMNRISDKINNLEINGFVPKVKQPQKRNQSVGGMNRSKDKNFRIMKKTLMDKREQFPFPSFGATNLGMIMITGLGQHSQHPVSQLAPSLPPKARQGPPSNFR